MASLLLVDDDGDIVEMLSDLLRREGHEVHTACNGAEGLKTLRDAPLPDAILLDVDMPIMSGPAMAHEMLLHDAGEEKIPVMLVSGSEDLANIARRLGTSYFLAKPANLSDVLRVLDRCLRERLAPHAT